MSSRPGVVVEPSSRPGAERERGRVSSRSFRLIVLTGLLLAGAMPVSACGSKPGRESVGSETNWLRTCSQDSDCEWGSCLCGVCSVDCAGNDSCDSAPGVAICAVANAAAYEAQCRGSAGPSSGMCLPVCNANDCGVGFACIDGTCTESLSHVALLHSVCDVQRGCCAGQGYALDPLANCEASLDRQLGGGNLLRKGTVVIDPSIMRATLATLREVAQTCVWPAQQLESPFRGTVAEGGACEDARECESTSRAPTACVITGNDAKLGVCRMLLRGRLGQACDWTCEAGDRDCSLTSSGNATDAALTFCDERDGLFCDSGATPHTCAPLVAASEPCASDRDCGSAAPRCKEGVCTLPPPEPVANEKTCVEGDPT